MAGLGLTPLRRAILLVVLGLALMALGAYDLTLERETELFGIWPFIAEFVAGALGFAAGIAAYRRARPQG